MPQVITDPTLRPGVITNSGEDLFSYPSVSQPSILGLQSDPSQPPPAGTSIATNLLNPDLQSRQHLRNFPADLFDLSPGSVLTHFMEALLGSGGVGQLRRRQLISRLQQAISSTHFYDLDGFYGALFGSSRGPGESLPVNPSTGTTFDPYTELASPDGWDEIEALDARYRERIITLARAISLGGTVPGLQAIAEAVTGYPCAVYEVWQLLTNAYAPVPGFYTWAEVMQANPTWSAIPAGETWAGVEGYISYTGLMGNGARNEVVLRPRKTYASTAEGIAERGADTFGILSVIEPLRPASSLVSVDSSDPGIVTPVPIAAAWSPSQYWELAHQVTPPDLSDPAYAAALTAYQAGGQVPGSTFLIPRPALSRSQGGQYTCAGDITSVTAQVSSGSVITDGIGYQTVVFPSPSGQQSVAYPPVQAVMPAAQAEKARATSAVTVQCAPYSGPRVPVVRAG